MNEGEMYVELGKRIRRVRNWREVRQESLARAIHLTRTSLSNIESGYQRLSVWGLVQLSFVLKVPTHIWMLEPREWEEWCDKNHVPIITRVARLPLAKKVSQKRRGRPPKLNKLYDYESAA